MKPDEGKFLEKKVWKSLEKNLLQIKIYYLYDFSFICVFQSNPNLINKHPNHEHCIINYTVRIINWIF